MGKFFKSCCTSSNAEDKKDADFTAYSVNDTALNGGTGASHSATGGYPSFSAMGSSMRGGGNSYGAQYAPGFSGRNSEKSTNGSSTAGDVAENGRNSPEKGGAPFSGAGSSALLTDPSGLPEKSEHGPRGSAGSDDNASMSSRESLSAAGPSSDLTRLGSEGSDVTSARRGSESANGHSTVIGAGDSKEGSSSSDLTRNTKSSSSSPTQQRAGLGAVADSTEGAVTIAEGGSDQNLTSAGSSSSASLNESSAGAPSTLLSSVDSTQAVNEESTSLSVA